MPKPHVHRDFAFDLSAYLDRKRLWWNLSVICPLSSYGLMPILDFLMGENPHRFALRKLPVVIRRAWQREKCGLVTPAAELRQWA